MDARLSCIALILAAANLASGGAYRTQNFIVQTHSSAFAKQVGDLAEQYRRDLAIEWLGHELPPWQQPCPITVKAAPHLGAGGATSFMFERGRPFGWKMSIQGSQKRILDSVLPHEVTHTIFATHFGGPLPRWADEGGCTVVEHPEEREKQKRFLYEFLTTGRGIPFNVMFRLKEYPNDIMPLYSQGHAVVSYLISQGGKRKFVDFVGTGMNTNDWSAAVNQFYGYQDLSDLQLQWNDWVAGGMQLPDANEQFVQADPASRAPQLDHAQLATLSPRGAPPVALASAQAAPLPQSIPNAQASSGSWYASHARGRQASVTASTSGSSFQPGSTRVGPAPSTRIVSAPPASTPYSSGPATMTRPQAMQQVSETVIDPGQAPGMPQIPHVNVFPQQASASLTAPYAPAQVSR